ncbi:MAG: DUF2339 domain-containing protein [Elusimicrobia bacterium]|nr:DUF2339 domain-containing protein [Elusimicrobiota bacterium]MDD7502376.1 DUF2339 domain-containing protein [Elusimicrobiota bacterium]MDY5729270.1 DUF2339 domain-containing protein [Elusimicrobiaceae bacterium]
MDTAILFVAIIGLVIWLLATQERISRLAWRLERLEKQALKSSEEPQKAPVRFVQTEAPREVSVKAAEKAKVSQKASSEFTIIKLFSWIGGFALLLAAAFWVKYALENNLISPQMRIGAGLLTGLALWVAGLYLKNPGYKTTSNTLCACGLTICYIISFAGYALYGMFALPLTFGLLAFISLAAFCTAVYKQTAYLGILAQIGAFVIPFLFSSAASNLLLLLVYFVCVNITALGTAYLKKWNKQFIISAIFTACCLLTILAQINASGAQTNLIAGFITLFALFYTAGAVALKDGRILAVGFITLGICLLVCKDNPGTEVSPLLLWASGTNILFAAVPFVFKKRFTENNQVWGTSVVAGVFLCLLWDRRLDFSNGLVPWIFALLYGGLTAHVWRWGTLGDKQQNKRLSWLLGTVVLFLTFGIAEQFEKGWLTLLLSLEGCGLVWLYRLLNIKTLLSGGKWLLIATTVRLVLNPAVLDYSPTPTIWNWFLGVYTVCAAALFAAAKGWPQRETEHTRALLQGLGGLVLFVLLNIEIAVVYSAGESLHFDFFGEVSAAAAYTLAWALSGALCLCFALKQKGTWLTKSGLILIGIALAKLFLCDVWKLSLGARIITLIGVALVLLAMSFLYQQVRLKIKQQNLR